MTYMINLWLEKTNNKIKKKYIYEIFLIGKFNSEKKCLNKTLKYI